MPALRSLPRLLGAILCWATPLAAQGLYWESSSTGGPAASEKDPPRLAKSYAMPKKLKRAEGDTAIIARLDKGALHVLHLKEKTYEDFAFADLEARLERVTKDIEALRANLKDLAPEQRKVVEKQLKRLEGQGVDDPVVEVTRTDETRQIAGHGCRKFVGKQAGRETLTVWASSEVKGFAALRADWLEVTRRIASVNPVMGRNRGLAFEKIEGFPLETRMGGVTTVVTRVEERATPDSEFEIPAGFTRKAPPAGVAPAPRGDAEKDKKKE